jgi:hypothetical protein
MCHVSSLRRRGKILAGIVSSSVASLFIAGSTRAATQFASGVPSYTEGTFATVSGAHYTNTSAALGQPDAMVGDNPVFAGALTPFNANYEQSKLAAFGLGGQLTMSFAQPVSIGASPQVGIFTKVALVDTSPTFSGVAGNPAQSDQMNEFGAERTAVVEVASSLGDFRSLGRVVFDDPSNAFTSANDPYGYQPDASAVPADFGMPFVGQPTDFNGKDIAGAIAILHGSGGGTWVTVPSSIGLSSIQYLRLSDPMWRIPDGTLVDERPSVYFPPPNQFVKPADLFVDAAVLIPEPGGALLVTILMTSITSRRAR